MTNWSKKAKDAAKALEEAQARDKRWKDKHAKPTWKSGESRNTGENLCKGNGHKRGKDCW